MKTAIPRRLARLVLLLLSISLLAFGMMRLAGSDVLEQKMLQQGTTLSEQELEESRRELGLDQPFLLQYQSWLSRLLHGDMGESYVSGQPVLITFLEKLPATILLALAALLLSLVISLPLGIYMAWTNGRGTLGQLIGGYAFLGNAMPNFFIALLLIYCFAVRWRMLPVLGSRSDMRSMILPALTLAIAMSAKYIKQIQVLFQEEMEQDYVLGAKAQGISEMRILWRKVLPQVMLPLVTLLAMSLGSLLGGTAIIESIFLWDGVGKLAVDAIRMRDYPVIQAYVLWMGTIFVAINFLTDLSYRFFDPRIARRERRGRA